MDPLILTAILILAQMKMKTMRNLMTIVVKPSTEYIFPTVNSEKERNDLKEDRRISGVKTEVSD